MILIDDPENTPRLFFLVKSAIAQRARLIMLGL